NNINLGDVFIVGFNIVPDTLNTNPEDNENATRIVSTFQEENASEYIKRGQGKEIYKTPNAHYFQSTLWEIKKMDFILYQHDGNFTD
ncbi:MAG: hypothetical protein EAZ55_13110, partial [Cytophagales bacterium]